METKENKRDIMQRLILKDLKVWLNMSVKRLNKKYLDEAISEEELLKGEKQIKRLQVEIKEVRSGKSDLRKYYDLPSVSTEFQDDEDYILYKIK